MGEGLKPASKLRVGVVGLGIGKVHLSGYKKLPNVEIAAVCDIVESRALEVAADYDCKGVYTDFTAMLSAA